MRNPLIFLSLAAAAVTMIFPGLAAQDIKYGAGSWDSESGLGNHRVIVRMELVPPAKGSSPTTKGALNAPGVKPAAQPRAARVIIPWRRRDLDPENKGLVVIDAATGARVQHVLPLVVNREYGDIVFETPTVPGDYYVYFMPYKSEGRKNYPNVKYDPPQWNADDQWPGIKGFLEGPSPKAGLAGPPYAMAKVVEIQSVDAFSSFFPMEVIASAAETRALLAAHPDAPYLVFPEDRRFSIRMDADLPERWIRTGPASLFKAEAAPGESFTFQLGLWAARTAIADTAVRFSDFGTVPASAAFCLNTGGVNWDSARFTKPVPVPLGKVQALWCGLPIPRDAAPGAVFSGTVTVAPRGLPETAVRVEITVSGAPVDDGGDADPHRLTRLRWLDSRLAVDDGLVPPYAPVEVRGATVSILGRTLTLGKDGLPARIQSLFAPEMTRLAPVPHDVVASPFRFRVLDAAGREIALKPDAAGPRFTKQAPGAASWETIAPSTVPAGSPSPVPSGSSGSSSSSDSRSTSASPGLTLSVSGTLEFDGFADYRLALAADRDIALSDIRLEIPVDPSAARYMMGLGFKGGERPASFDWSWDQKKNQDALWLGAVDGGLQVCLRAENYSRPLNTNFYLSKPLNMPLSWWNDGKGTVSVRTLPRGPDSGLPPGSPTGPPPPSPSVVLVAASSGPRTLHAGETLHFDFTLLLTPFKLLDPASHFSERYFHAYKPLDEIAAAGANVVNIHHATEINPYINYPFLRSREMKAYVDDAHRRGMKVKIYDTVRELSNRAPELFALRSLGHEIFSPGPGGGYSWLQEHLGGDYIAAWFVPELKDAAVINSGMSRWHNYYVEGLDWLAKNAGIDGLYLDDVAFDRTTMKRVRKVLDRDRPGALIDLHSANQYNPRDGFASSANLYLEHFPFLNRLWFGEYFDYEGSGPDYWLVEMSGIPFGLMGEMLQDGGNPWRGMVFGMTSRLPWAGDPRPLWKAWDDFGIASSEIVGWWVASNPVKTGNKDVLATIYVKTKKTGRTVAEDENGGEANGTGAGRAASGRAAATPSSRVVARSEATRRSQGRSALIALASWAKTPVEVRLAIDWKALGLDPKRAVLAAPAIEKFQPAAEFRPGDAIRIEPGKGWLLILAER